MDKSLRAFIYDTFDTIYIRRELLICLLYRQLNQCFPRVKFLKENIAIVLHKPHPRKELLEYQIKQVLETLEKEELL